MARSPAPANVGWWRNSKFFENQERLENIFFAPAEGKQSLPERGQAEMRQSVGAGKSRPCHLPDRRQVTGFIVLGNLVDNESAIQIRNSSPVRLSTRVMTRDNVRQG